MIVEAQFAFLHKARLYTQASKVPGHNAEFTKTI